MRRLVKFLMLGGALAAVAVSVATSYVGALARQGDDDSASSIEVRGQWRIEIRDPDGSLANVVEFENHLESSGARLLASLLRGDAVGGNWNIQLWSEGTEAQLCQVSTATDTPTVCNLHTPSFTPMPGGSATLDVQYGTLAFDGALVLDGVFVADRTGVVTRVVTQNYSCDAAVTLADCRDDIGRSSHWGDAANFTETTIDPLDVQAGQEVAVTVVISFS